MKDPLHVHRRLPNEGEAKAYLIDNYGPVAKKTFTGALEAFFAIEFPQLAGERARRSVVQGIVELVHRFYPATTHLRQGQTTWVTVAKDEQAAYGKTVEKTRLVPVIVSLIGDSEAQQRCQGKRLREIKIDAIARACQEIDAQGGCVTAAELAILFKTTDVTVGKYIAEWEQRHHQRLPRRGTIHDMGPTLTHKRDICRLLFIDGKTVSEVVRLTKHSPAAIDRYITHFRQVFTCRTKGLTPEETARATKISRRLVDEYHRLFDEYAVTSAQFEALLNEALRT